LTRLATVGDQVVVSLASFVLALAIGRSFPAEALASYGIGISVGLMIQAVHKHSIVIPLVLQPDARVARRRGGLLAAHLIVLGCLLLSGCAATLVADRFASHYGYLVVAASVVSLIVYVQLDFARAILLKLDRPLLLCAHGAWYAGVCAALAMGATTHRMSYELLLLILSSAMLIAALPIAAMARPLLPRQGLNLLSSDMARYGGWATVASATNAGYNHVPLLVLGAAVAPVHAAAFVATRSLMQPLQILLRGLDLADKKLFAKNVGDPHARPALRFTLKLAGIYALAAGTFGLVAAIFAEPLIALAYGGNFSGHGSALIAWAPAFVLLSMTMPFESLVYTRNVFREYYFVRAIASVVAILLTALLVTKFFEVGAIAACSAGSFLVVAGTVMILARGTRP
jgi:O-antigen/teichoic acid export membrane protein